MKIFKSFKYAIKGIIYTLKNERHMRIHIVASICVLILSLFFDFNPEKYILLFLTIAFVIVSEIINSAIESVIDIFAKEYNSVAKVAKDMAAGAVLIASITAVFVGLILFSDISVYLKILKIIYYNPMILILVLAFICTSYFYIFWGPAEIKNHIKNKINKIKR